MADRRRSGEDWKIEVLCCLDQAGHQPPSVTDIARQIKPTNPNAARSAVHKALVRLKRLGEVEASERSHRSRAITPQGRWRLSRPGLRSAPEPSLELPQRRTSLPVLPRVAGGEPISLEAYADWVREPDAGDVAGPRRPGVPARGRRRLHGPRRHRTRERAMFRLLRDLYRRMGVGNRTQALIRAHERGWLG
jgi:hypothetical protein